MWAVRLSQSEVGTWWPRPPATSSLLLNWRPLLLIEIYSIIVYNYLLFINSHFRPINFNLIILFLKRLIIHSKKEKKKLFNRTQEILKPILPMNLTRFFFFFYPLRESRIFCQDKVYLLLFYCYCYCYWLRNLIVYAK